MARSKKTEKTSNVDKLYAEKTWLGDIYPRSRVHEVKVKPWTKELLGRSVVVRSSMYGRPIRYRGYLLGASGQVITRIGRRWWCPITLDETVGHALKRIGWKANHVFYAMFILDEWMYFYKVPNGCGSAADWVRTGGQTIRY